MAIIAGIPFAFDPIAAAAIALAAALYVRALATLRRRGVTVARRQQLAWYTGLSLFAVALVGPIPALGESLFSAHMSEHLLIAEIGAPLLLIGIRSPVLLFLLPPRVLVPLARSRRLHGITGVLRRPLVAIAVYVVALFSWHYELLFEGTLHSDAVHGAQHASFVFASILVWWVALEPERRRMRGELWKIAHIVGARLGGMFLGMVFILMRTPAYDEYADSAPEYGLDPLFDQQLGGAMMLTLDAVIVVFALCFFFWRAAQDEDMLREREAAARG